LGTQPSRALLITAGLLTQLIGFVCLILALASLPVAHDLASGMTGVIASAVAALAAIVCGSLVWRGRLVPLALAAGLDIGFGVALPRGGSALGAMLRILPADEADTAETMIMAAAIAMFVAAILCVLAIPSALRLRRWARAELARDPAATDPSGPPDFDSSPIDENAPTKERPRVSRPSAQPMIPTPQAISAGNTLRGIGSFKPSQKLMPTQVIRVDTPRSKPLVIVGVAVTLIAIGVIVITAATGTKSTAVAGTAPEADSTTRTATDGGIMPNAPTVAPTVDAGIDAPPPAAIADFIPRFHTALAAATPAALGPLFDAKAFAFGVESHDLAEGRDAIVAQLREDIGKLSGRALSISTKFSHIAAEGGVAWLAEELKVGAKTFFVTAVLGLRDNIWTIDAMHWAQAMPDETAFRLAREGELAIPDAIPDSHDDSPLAHAMRTAFASRPSFVEARSAHAEAINFGSAGERLKGGETIKRVLGKLKASIRLRDAVKVGAVGERGGWGIANIDFTATDRDGTEVTQTFRVLAAWIKEDAGWRIVQSHWSNAR
jgi:hypothetical protein